MAINTEGITELSALNTMATYIGIPFLLDIADIATEPDMLVAQRILNTTTKEVLNKGLELNTDWDYPLTQELDGTVLVPAGTLRWKVKYDYEERYTERNGVVYDKINHTSTLNSDLTVDIVWNLTFESLPEMVKNYIAVKSAYRFVGRMKGSDSVMATIQQDLGDAEYEFNRYETGSSDLTLLDNYEVYAIASRHLDYTPNIR
jgi:hypothetical protein